MEEALEYFSSGEERTCVPTAYTVAENVHEEYGECWWWLRSSGATQTYATNVYFGGGVQTYGYDVDVDDGAVRPAMWIDIDA